ncbi:MAG: hypothetical protein K1V96_08735 [Lachnospiraceae bacterium]
MGKKKKHVKLVVITTVLAVSAGALFFGRHAIVHGIKAKASVEIGKRLIEGQLGENINIGGIDVNVSDIVENIEEEDVEQVGEIVEKYISPSTIKSVTDMVSNGDTAGLQELAEEQLTEEDKAKLQEIYDKYKDQIPEDLLNSIPVS